MPQEIELTELDSATPLQSSSQPESQSSNVDEALPQGGRCCRRFVWSGWCRRGKCVTFLSWLELLKRTFGFKFLIILVCSQHMLKGFAAALCQTGALTLLRSYNVKGQRMNIYIGTAMLPWAMKPVIGLDLKKIQIFLKILNWFFVESKENLSIFHKKF